MENNILVVDDEEPIRYMMSEVLGASGYNVICAENGKSALEIIKNEDVHVIFLDLKLPLMNGLEICTEIRKRRSADFICAMTGFASNYSLVQCRQTGFDDYFIKPFEIPALLEVTNYGFERLKRWKGYCKNLNLDVL